MATEEQKTELLDDFQKYLEQSQTSPFSAKDQPDLNTLLGELTELKTEVKAESRQFKNTLDTLSTTLDTVQEDNKRLIQQQNEMMRSILLDLIEVYDRLSAGVDILQHYQPVNSLFKHSKKKDIRFIKQFKDGQVMTMSRFEQLLQQHQVKEIECVGKMLNPTTMIAAETEQDSSLENGIVIEALRKGFLYQNQVLRLAEVKVNKI